MEIQSLNDINKIGFKLFLSLTLINNMKRFANNSEADMAALLNGATSEHTKKQTMQAWKFFISFLETSSYDETLLTKPNDEIDAVLSTFFGNLRKSDGEKMKTNSFNSVKYALNRKLKQDYNIDLMNTSAFPKVHMICKAVVVDLKKTGNGYTNHYDRIDDADIKKIFRTLDHNIPTQLQWLTFFIIQLYFCRRGRENLEKFTKQTFKISKSLSGRRFLSLAEDELIKNRRENDSEGNNEGGRIYENLDIEICPLRIVEMYISKLCVQCDRFWQYSKNSFLNNDKVWYQNRPIGIHGLEKFMVQISTFCSLSKRYTNHCIRVTNISILCEVFTENEVAHVSRHKSAHALGIYKRLNDNKKAGMSDLLTNRSLELENPKSTADISIVPIQNANNNNNRQSTPPPVLSHINNDEITSSTFSAMPTLSQQTTTLDTNISCQKIMKMDEMKSFTFNNCTVNMHFK